MNARIGPTMLTGMLMFALPGSQGAMMDRSPGLSGDSIGTRVQPRPHLVSPGIAYGSSSGFHGGTGFRGDFRDHRTWGSGRGFDHDGGFHHRRYFNNGFSFGFYSPLYYSYPGYAYYGYPPAYAYGGYYPYDDSPPPPPRSEDSGYGNNGSQYRPADQQTHGYYQVGHDWGQDLRRDIVSWDKFVDYVNESIVNMTQGQKDEFRRGFIPAYGGHAQEALDKAMQQARDQPHTKVVEPPARRPEPGSDNY